MEAKFTKAPLPNADTLSGRVQTTPDYTPWYKEQNRRIARNPFNLSWREFGRVPTPQDGENNARQTGATSNPGNAEESSSSNLRHPRSSGTKDDASQKSVTVVSAPSKDKFTQQHLQIAEQLVKQCTSSSRPSSQMSSTSRSRFADRLISSWSGPLADLQGPASGVSGTSCSHPSSPRFTRPRLFLKAAGGTPRRLSFAAPEISNPGLFNGRCSNSAQGSKQSQSQAAGHSFFTPAAPEAYKKEFESQKPASRSGSPRSVLASSGVHSNVVAGALSDRSTAQPTQDMSHPSSHLSHIRQGRAQSNGTVGLVTSGKEPGGAGNGSAAPSPASLPRPAQSVHSNVHLEPASPKPGHGILLNSSLRPPWKEASSEVSQAATRALSSYAADPTKPSTPTEKPLTPKMSAPSGLALMAKPGAGSTISLRNTKKWPSTSTKVATLKRAGELMESSGTSSSCSGSVTRGQVYASFSLLDQQGSGKLTFSQIELAGIDLGMKPEQISHFFSILDPNKRGYCTIKEWGGATASTYVKSFTRLFFLRAAELRKGNSGNSMNSPRTAEPLEATTLGAALQLVQLKMKVKNRGHTVPFEKYKEVFQFIDENCNGVLSVEELADAFSGMGITVSDEVLEESMAYFDENRSGELDYDEFMGALYPLIGPSYNEARGKCSGKASGPTQVNRPS